MDSQRRGLGYGLAAYLCWGLFPLYWPLLKPAGALEILACRIVFSALAVAALLAVGHRLGGVARLGRLALTRLAVAGLLIGVNWGCYIWGVNNGHVVETSLGYFINPLVTVALGVIVLHERLRPVQWAALGLGLLAVMVITADYGRPPWLALTLAVSFGCYALGKKRVGVGAPEGLLVEASVLVLPAVALLAVLGAQGSASYGRHGPRHDLLLLSAGVATAIPLLFFAGAATRLPLTTLGLLQYLAPVLQLATGVFVRHEPMPPARLAGFVLVWVALVALAVDGVRHRGSPGAAPAVVSEPETADIVSSPA